MADQKIVDFAAKKAAGISGDKKKTHQPDKTTKISGSAIEVGLKKPSVNLVGKDGKVVEVDPSKVDPQATVNVKNPKVDELIDKFSEEKNDANLNELVNELEKSRILVPAKMGKGNLPIPLTINTTDGKIIQPVFTDRSKMENAPKCEIIMNLPFVAILATVVEKGPDIEGIGINPFGKAVIFKRELLERMVELLKQKSAAAQVAKTIPGGAQAETVTNEDGTTSTRIKMNEEQYTLFERSRFEVGFLPKKLRENGQELIDGLLKDKEEYLDKLYEESYTEKRMYPYLVDEFKVVGIGLSDTRELVTITMPTRNMAPGIAETVYMVWDKDTNKGRYFAIVAGRKKDSRDIIEVGEDGKPVVLGAAPDEGTELNWIMNKIAEN